MILAIIGKGTWKRVPFFLCTFTFLPSCLYKHDGKSEIIATTKYEFKEKGFNEDGSFSHYVTPRADPKIYEDPFDYIFDTKKEALAFIREQVEEECIEAEEVNNWVLVKVTTTEINVKLV